MVVNTILSVVLFQVMDFAGIALGTVLASWLNIAMLSWTLHKRGQLVADARLRGRLPRILLSSVGMGLCVWGIAWLLADILGRGVAWQALGVTLLVGAGVAVFGALAVATGGASVSDVRQLLRRRPAA
jgi:putative peptidoglycan lipid II flippase